MWGFVLTYISGLLTLPTVIAITILVWYLKSPKVNLATKKTTKTTSDEKYVNIAEKKVEDIRGGRRKYVDGKPALAKEGMEIPKKERVSPEKKYSVGSSEEIISGWIRVSQPESASILTASGRVISRGGTIFAKNKKKDQNRKDEEPEKQSFSLENKNRIKGAVSCFARLLGGTLSLYDCDEEKKQCIGTYLLSEYEVKLHTDEEFRESRIYSKKSPIILQTKQAQYIYGTETSDIKDVKETAEGTQKQQTLSEKKDVATRKEENEKIERNKEVVLYIYTETSINKEDWYLELLTSSLINDDNQENVRNKTIICEGLRYAAEDDERFGKWENEIGETSCVIERAIERYCIGMLKTKKIRDLFITKLRQKFSKLKLPTLFSSMTMTGLEVGEEIPKISNIRMSRDKNKLGRLEVDFDMEYTGGFTVTVDVEVKLVNITLTFKVMFESFVGQGKLVVKRPPSNRIWVGFKSLDSLKLEMQHTILQKEIKYRKLINALKTRLIESFKSSTELPNMMDILFLKANDTGGIYEDMLYYGGDEEDIPFVESSTGTDFNGSLATSATETADAIVEPTDKLISGGSTENINAGGVVKTSSFINKVSSIRSRVNKILTDKSLSTVRTEPSNVVTSEGKKSVITGHLVQDKQQEQIIKSMLKERDNRKRTNSNVSAISLEDDQAASKLHQKSSESMFSDSDKKSKDEPKNQAREDAYYLAGSSGTESRRSVLKDTTTKDNARTEGIIKNKTTASPNKIQQDASIIQDVVDQYASVKPIQSGPESSASKAVDTKVLTKPSKAAITLANANAGVDVDVNTNTPTNPIINQTIKQTVNQTLNQDTNPTVNTKSNSSSSSSSSSTSSTPFPSSISTTTTLVGNAAERAVTDTKNHLTDSSRPNTVDRISQKLEMARKGKMSDADGFSARLRAKNQLLASLKSTTATKIPSDDDDNISINTIASTSTSSSTDSKRSVFGKTKHGISGLFSAGKSKLRSKNSNITNPTINEGTKNDSMYLKTKKIDHATHVEDQVGHKDHFLGDSEFKLPDPKISNPPNTQQLKDKSMNHDGTPAIDNMDINTTKPTTSQSQQGTLRPSHIDDSSDTPEASLEHPPSSLATTPPKVTAAFPPINTDSSNTGTDTNAATSDITKNNVGEPATPKLPVNQVGYTPVSISFQKQPDQPPTTDVSQPSLPFPDTHLRRTFDLSSLPALDAALPKYPSRSVHAARNNSVDRTGKAAYTYPTDTPALAAKSGSQLSNSTSPRSPLLIASHNSPNTDHPFFGGSNSLYSYPSASSKKSSLRSSLDYTASPSLTSNVFSSSTYSDRSPLNSVKIDDITNFERLMSQPHQNPGSRNRSVVLDFDVHSTPQNTISGGGGGTNDGLKINNNSDAINKTLDSNGKEKKVLGSYSVLLQPLPRLE